MTTSDSPLHSGAQDASNGAAAGAVRPADASQSPSTATSPGKRDGDQADDDDNEEVITLQEVLQEQSELDEAAVAVLGEADADHCSYALGYHRQALYACLTCTQPRVDAESGAVEGAAGVCLACSYHCHADHELVELYTKRAFRCDCGTSRLPAAAPCALWADKDAVNAGNAYSHNFAGRYCTCRRPYPDPERTTPEVMVQCIVCEDWLHEEHIGALPAAFDEMICAACMARHAFLAAYQALEPQAEDAEAEDEEEDKDKQQQQGCVLQALLDQQPAAATGATFWQRDWRTRLCPCSKCVARLERAGLAFLMDPEDSLQAYEERAAQQQQQRDAADAERQQRSSPVQRSALSSPAGETTDTTVEAALSSLEQAAQRAFETKLSHEQQVEMARGYSHMKTKLHEYLSGFAASGQTVKAQDIQQFFESLRASKRPRHS
ncbi:hypothetical protein P43SY_002111 [Pythium insidiosum]|uniref:UBR-type domain-containing protein n=1 Tax=Pythium insidiosum TaxID=114742 RepID=A0AAD5LSE0_PYTIN|nr:hypothetical protein P43SY_002111 [Pythium insidiosum]